MHIAAPPERVVEWLLALFETGKTVDAREPARRS